MMKNLNHKYLLNCCNSIFLVCGGSLIFGGLYMFTDSKRILLSRLLTSTSEQLNSLPQPIFFYTSLGIAVAGTIAVLVSIIGFWASFLNTYCFFGLYFLAVTILLLAESVVCIALTLWPQCLGISLNAMEMVKALQGNYGIPGREQFTIAMDLTQTQFKCCGMNSEINYDTSMWRLQSFGTREWVVPLSCCTLYNENESLSYLDPKPYNESQCQTLQKLEFSEFRHTKSCLEYLNAWYKDQYLIFLGVTLLIVIVEFFVLLSVILSCSKLSKKYGSTKEFIEIKKRAQATNPSSHIIENIYGPDVANARTLKSDGDRSINESKEVYIQPRDLLQSWHNTTFKPRRHQYHVSTESYIV